MFLIDDFLKGQGQKSAAKEQYKKGEEEAAGQFKSDTAAFGNAEKTRQSRAQALINGLGSLFVGKYAGLVGNGVRENLVAPRESTAFKHAVVDPSKGAMWNTFGNMANSAGNLALSALSGSNLLKGLGIGQSAGGAAPTSLRPGASQTTLLPEDDPRNWGG